MADLLEKLKCDHCGKVITGKGKRFCGQRCSHEWGRKVRELRREFSEAIPSYPAAWDDEEEWAGQIDAD